MSEAPETTSPSAEPKKPMELKKDTRQELGKEVKQKITLARSQLREGEPRKALETISKLSQ